MRVEVETKRVPSADPWLETSGCSSVLERVSSWALTQSHLLMDSVHESAVSGGTISGTHKSHDIFSNFEGGWVGRHETILA